MIELGHGFVKSKHETYTSCNSLEITVEMGTKNTQDEAFVAKSFCMEDQTAAELRRC